MSFSTDRASTAIGPSRRGSKRSAADRDPSEGSNDSLSPGSDGDDDDWTLDHTEASTSSSTGFRSVSTRGEEEAPSHSNDSFPPRARLRRALDSAEPTADSTSPSGAPSASRKRAVRTGPKPRRFQSNPEQVAIFVTSFDQADRPSKEERQRLAREATLLAEDGVIVTERHVTVWFQNRRQHLREDARDGHSTVVKRPRSDSPGFSFAQQGQALSTASYQPWDVENVRDQVVFEPGPIALVPVETLLISHWVRHLSPPTGVAPDLVVYASHVDRRFSYFISHGGQAYKMDVPFSSVLAIETAQPSMVNAWTHEVTVRVRAPPMMLCARKEGSGRMVWEGMMDFTDGVASRARDHRIRGTQATLSAMLEICELHEELSHLLPPRPAQALSHRSRPVPRRSSSSSDSQNVSSSSIDLRKLSDSSSFDHRKAPSPTLGVSPSASPGISHINNMHLTSASPRARPGSALGVFARSSWSEVGDERKSSADDSGFAPSVGSSRRPNTTDDSFFAAGGLTRPLDFARHPSPMAPPFRHSHSSTYPAHPSSYPSHPLPIERTHPQGWHRASDEHGAQGDVTDGGGTSFASSYWQHGSSLEISPLGSMFPPLGKGGPVPSRAPASPAYATSSLPSVPQNRQPTALPFQLHPATSTSTFMPSQPLLPTFPSTSAAPLLPPSHLLSYDHPFATSDLYPSSATQHERHETGSSSQSAEMPTPTLDQYAGFVARLPFDSGAQYSSGFKYDAANVRSQPASTSAWPQPASQFAPADAVYQEDGHVAFGGAFDFEESWEAASGPRRDLARQ